ncbi:hypothetical protein LTR27_006696 [Elasticomyces elasticus]|nr:hypothetical protein LTR27_006696 [Elasticomyces elasticus]
MTLTWKTEAYERCLTPVMHAIRGLRSPAHPTLSRSRRPNARYAHSPSTVDTGFILSLPPLPNPATSDPAYQRVLTWYIPEPFLKQVLPQLEAFGKEAVSPQINELISDTERQQPYIKDRNVWGGKVNRLVTSTGWKELAKEEGPNGIHFHRLKNKMGTKELPTAELELRDVRAWRVGPADRGIATIATLLNVTRTHNFITALSCWRRGMAIAKNFARVRTTIDQPLWTFPMHLRLLASMETKFHGLLQLAFFTSSLLSFADHGLPPHSPSYAPLPEPGKQMKVIQRTLTAAGKAVICKVACVSLQECQEAMGGVGYMDEPDEPEHNISRLYRDTAANMTWEGTTNVLASEVVRHLLKDDHLQIFSTWIEDAVLAKVRDEDLRRALESSWGILKLRLSDDHGDLGAALADGRQLMFSLAWVVSGALLAHDAQRDGNTAACEVARRWILRGEGGVGEYAFPDVLRAGAIGDRQSNRERLNWDCRIVWGVDLPADAATGYRSSPSASSGRPEQVVARL